MKLKTVALGILLSFTCPVLRAQSPPADPLAENLFSPELVLQHQSDIGLTEEQRNALIAEVQKAQERFSDLQQRLQKEVEALGTLLKREQVEEQAALAQFDKVLSQEREVKRAHLAFVLGIRSKLTREQQAKLRDIKSKIAIFAIGGGEPKFISDQPAYYGRLRWTPDGSGLAYAARQQGVGNIWVQPLDGSAPKQLTHWNPNPIFSFGWSPDGKWLAYASGTLTSDVVLISNLAR